MVFLRAISVNDQLPEIRGTRIYLRAPMDGDYDQWSVLRRQSREFLTPWEPRWPSGDLTRSAFKRRIRRYNQERRGDTAYPFFLFSEPAGVLLGGLTASNVRRGAAQTASIGYWIGVHHAGKGYMSEAVRAFLPHAFGLLRLNRVEAACLPSNAPSIRLLRRCGFAEEGYARDYLCIDGQWRDHVLFAALAKDKDAAAHTC